MSIEKAGEFFPGKDGAKYVWKRVFTRRESVVGAKTAFRGSSAEFRSK